MALSLSACTGTALRPPADIARAGERLEASERKRWGLTRERDSFRLGDQRIGDVVRGGSESTGYSVFGFGEHRVSTSYTFVAQGPSSRLQGRCTLEQNGTQSTFVGELACQCGSDVVRAAVGRDAKDGELSLAEQSYTLRALRERANGRTSDDPLGYRIDPSAGGPALGAVEVQAPGRVWLRHGLTASERASLICLLGGVLLHRPITTHARPAT